MHQKNPKKTIAKMWPGSGKDPGFTNEVCCLVAILFRIMTRLKPQQTIKHFVRIIQQSFLHLVKTVVDRV